MIAPRRREAQKLSIVGLLSLYSTHCDDQPKGQSKRSSCVRNERKEKAIVKYRTV